MNASFRHRMPNDLHERVKKLAAEYGISVTALINLTMKEVIKSQDYSELEKRIEEIERQLADKK